MQFNKLLSNVLFTGAITLYRVESFFDHYIDVSGSLVFLLEGGVGNFLLYDILAKLELVNPCQIVSHLLWLSNTTTVTVL